nr:unnamed protein product [Digitaria exilis]
MEMHDGFQVTVTTKDLQVAGAPVPIVAGGERGYAATAASSPMRWPPLAAQPCKWRDSMTAATSSSPGGSSPRGGKDQE